MTRVFVDTNVFLYALGTSHPYRDPCRTLVGKLARREIAGETSVEVLQEFMHVRRRRGPGMDEAVMRTREIMAWDLPLHEVGEDDLRLALELLTASGRLPVRDAVHAATARNRGIDVILSTDRDFDSMPGFDRIDPADEAAIERVARRGLD